MSRVIPTVIACGTLAALMPACGSSTRSSAGSLSQNVARPTQHGEGPEGASALSAEAKSAATGDIPDNQVFLAYRNAAAGYSMSYPEGWAIKARGPEATISEKNNLVHVVIESAGPPSPASLAAELTRLKRSDATLTFSAPRVIRVKSGTAVKATYATRSAPNPVTGKSVLLTVDRYELSRDGKRATIDLGTPEGVDNVDAYRMMINSFRWQ